MPEHYEVKRMAKYLKDHGVLGQQLVSSEFRNKGERILAAGQSLDLFLGSTLTNIHVKAKYTGFEFDRGTVIVHYRFTGIPHLRGIPYGDRLQTIFSLPIKYSNPDHCRFVWQFESLHLDYYDTRCLSKMAVFDGLSFQNVPMISRIPDDIATFKPLSFKDFRSLFKHRKKQLKLWLLDQTIAPSGIGNYLACEILAYANLNPFLSISSLSKHQYESLIMAIFKVRDFAEAYSHYDWFRVFNRETCQTCNAKITKKRVPLNAQSTHYCECCQFT
tara:strand:- start:3386 stop:4207 length:822 start_codon:yes stop_codon:yes gene_type:complete